MVVAVKIARTNASSALFVAFRTSPVTKPDIAMLLGTDRSTPPVRITNVMPTDAIASVLDCLNMFIRFVNDRKALDMQEKTAISKTITAVSVK